ncbi:hypothetical protein [Sideroxydans lithotrophicus]|uniref:Uncharacterized protein n=1 Tax=Sideroxydans lithotrophicus (strain ES-1) TaxID=580332 RepID=D5CUJ1_SIDLE|nr:hypothetical protein [Sideroxydans lithotrophicus]ADE12378.1 hypothetical protein Slit_2150 [Sideroxydans lithotrophicus ES-1]
MANRHIVFVPGKNPKPRAAQHRELLWRTLVEGVRRADSHVAEELQHGREQFHLASWNYLYYHKYKDVTREIPWIDALINKHGPTKQDIQDANSWKVRISGFILNLVDHVPVLIRLLPEDARSTDQEIRRYFSNGDNVAAEMRKLVKHILRPLLEKQEPVLLIGHSLGSVIAYDALWEMTHQEKLQGKVDFLTIGSPLGMHYIQRYLMGMNGGRRKSYPGLIRHWINLSSEGDLVSLKRNLYDSFGAMLEQGLVESIEDHCQGIYNFFCTNEGLNSHRSFGYLVNPAVGSIIADWWKRN